MKDFNCPSCGGLIQQKYGFISSIVCQYCGQTSYIEGLRLEKVGTPFFIADYGSCLLVGESMQINNDKYEVLGRVRFEYKDGFWDEWELVDTVTNTIVTFLEDENELILYKDKISIETPLKNLEIASYVSIQHYEIYIIEYDKIKVIAAQGQLSSRLKLGDTITFLNGIVDCGPGSIRIPPNIKPYLLKGQPVNVTEMKFPKR